MHQLLVLVQELGRAVLLPADVTLEQLQLLVDTFDVDLQDPLPGELLFADVALEPPDLLVDLEDVSLHVYLEGKGVIAELADELLDAVVDGVDVVEEYVLAVELFVASENENDVLTSQFKAQMQKG